MKIPVLTYHSTNISGNDYHNNDHIAFQADLALILKNGIKVISAKNLVEWLNGGLEIDSSHNYVVLTFDDGCELDYIDWQHPSYGPQKSFYSILKLYQKYVHATSFVIASAKVRRVLEQTCLAGNKIWGDGWWQDVEKSGLISIENHSWDHLHTTLDNVQQQDNRKGNFKLINSFADAQAQIEQSSKFIDSIIKEKKTSLFAYPYGDYNSYLINEYFPNEQREIQAAFSCDPEYVSETTNKWKIPRYVCGSHWCSPSELKNILELKWRV